LTVSRKQVRPFPGNRNDRFPETANDRFPETVMTVSRKQMKRIRAKGTVSRKQYRFPETLNPHLAGFSIRDTTVFKEPFINQLQEHSIRIQSPCQYHMVYHMGIYLIQISICDSLTAQSMRDRFRETVGSRFRETVLRLGFNREIRMETKPEEKKEETPEEKKEEKIEERREEKKEARKTLFEGGKDATQAFIDDVVEDWRERGYTPKSKRAGPITPPSSLVPQKEEPKDCPHGLIPGYCLFGC
jgi:hypothetical protein